MLQLKRDRYRRRLGFKRADQRRNRHRQRAGGEGGASGSPRAANPLVYLNCAALPESVAESELFGHVKGAFTGAISNRSGKFEMADNGTLFLDEIGELSLALQAKLLRVLQYGDIQRVGDDRSLRVDVRVLAATNRDLRQEVVEGRFRADLFPSAERLPAVGSAATRAESDVVLLAGYFCEQCRLRMGLARVILAEAARNRLQQWSLAGQRARTGACYPSGGGAGAGHPGR